jgi:hypothetical protein
LPAGDPRPDDAERARPFFRSTDKPAKRRRRRRPQWQGSGYEYAAVAEQLIALGHNPVDVMDYTPRQAAAFVTIAMHRRRRELAEQLHIATVAAHGDAKAIRETLKELADDAR